MGQLLLVVFVIAVLFIAPLKVAGLLIGGLLLSTLVVQATASSVGRTPITLVEAFKALVLSTFFSMVAILTVASFMSGAGIQALREAGPTAQGLALGLSFDLAATALLYGAYFLGFRVALGLPFLHSALVAVVSTLIISLCWWLGLRLLA
jgi:hypothetical protein